MFDHFQRDSLSHGYSPGNGVTPMSFSKEPLASEGEATPGADDYNPYDEIEQQQMREARSPTDGDDPFVFDDVDEFVGDVELPEPGDGPLF